MNNKEEIINKLQECTKNFPNWRVGQIIANAIRAYDGRLNCDPFYIDDKKLLEGLNKLDEYLK